jgi:hypothetical protein
MSRIDGSVTEKTTPSNEVVVLLVFTNLSAAPLITIIVDNSLECDAGKNTYGQDTHFARRRAIDVSRRVQASNWKDEAWRGSAAIAALAPTSWTRASGLVSAFGSAPISLRSRVQPTMKQFHGEGAARSSIARRLTLPIHTLRSHELDDPSRGTQNDLR